MCDKVIRDGLVAVLHTPELDSGWSTDNPELGAAAVFCPALVDWVERRPNSGQRALQVWLEEGVEIATSAFPDKYVDAYHLEHLQVAWVPEGSRFVIVSRKNPEAIIRAWIASFAPCEQVVVLANVLTA